jgi:hypothetical protein
MPLPGTEQQNDGLGDKRVPGLHSQLTGQRVKLINFAGKTLIDLELA